MTAQTCTLYLVRHGQTQWNIDHTIQGHADVPLTKRGEQQAHDQREKLKNISFSKVYSSDLIRAFRTAEILNLERKLAIQTTQALRERNFGSYQGKSMEEAGKKLWDILDLYDNRHPHLKETGVEINEQMIGRIITFLRALSVAHQGENILIVTHGGVIGLILQHLGYARKNEFPHIENLAYIKLECDGEDFAVKETSGIEINSNSLII